MRRHGLALRRGVIFLGPAALAAILTLAVAPPALAEPVFVGCQPTNGDRMRIFAFDEPSGGIWSYSQDSNTLRDLCKQILAPTPRTYEREMGTRNGPTLFRWPTRFSNLTCEIDKDRVEVSFTSTTYRQQLYLPSDNHPGGSGWGPEERSGAPSTITYVKIDRRQGKLWSSNGGGDCERIDDPRKVPNKF